MGYFAVNELIKGTPSATVGIRGSQMVTTSLEEALRSKELKLDEELITIAEVMNV